MSNQQPQSQPTKLSTWQDRRDAIRQEKQRLGRNYLTLDELDRIVPGVPCQRRWKGHRERYET